MKRLIPALLLPAISFAHHGVASLGVAGLEGPGAPIETSTSATLPEGSFLIYTKLDYAKFKKYTKEKDGETDIYNFWMFGIGYGLKPWLSLYLFLPYNVKKKEDNSFNTVGFGDLVITTVLGFKYDEGFVLVPKDENLDELLDWHFTIFASVSLPTGDPNVKDWHGNIDPSMSMGFGKPTLTIGFTSTKMLSERYTLTSDLSYLKFFRHTYSDGTEYKFGNEFRFNIALAYRLLTDVKRKLRFDPVFELNFLHIDRDEENGVKLRASGGDILYAIFGGRLYYKSVSASGGLKYPVWKDLNEESQQQGSEGKEKYRLIFSLSFLF